MNILKMLAEKKHVVLSLLYPQLAKLIQYL